MASERVQTRRQFHLAFYGGLWIDEHGVRRTELNSPFAELTDRSIGLEGGEATLPTEAPVLPGDSEDSPVAGYQRRGPGGPSLAGRADRVSAGRQAAIDGTAKNPATFRSRGSNLMLNLMLLAALVGQGSNSVGWWRLA